MIAAIEIQEFAPAAAEKQIQYAFVKDAELVHVGGGTTFVLV